jgi:uncharacterized small protein (DUF1192 family)
MSDAEAEDDVPIVMLGELRQVEAEVGRLEAENERLRAERDAASAERDAVIRLCISPEYGTGGHQIFGGFRTWGHMQQWAVDDLSSAVAAVRSAAGLDPDPKADPATPATLS